MNIVESFEPVTATLGSELLGILIGYALKKVIKIAAVIAGLFLAGLAYLPSQQIANINWKRLQTISKDAITTLSNAVTQIPGISGNADSRAVTAASLAKNSFGIH